MRLGYVLRKRTGQLALVLAVGFVVIGFFGSALAPYGPLDASAAPLAPPSTSHWFGTDSLGRDILSRILAGAGISLLGGVLVSLVAFFVGTIPGILSAAEAEKNAAVGALGPLGADAVAAVLAINRERQFFVAPSKPAAAP